MDAKREIILEYKKDERIYRLSLPENAPLGETYEATGAFMDEIIRLINESASKRAIIEDEISEEKEKPMEEG